jgi:hypothetical protein
MRLENSDGAAMADANQPLTETEAAARLGLRIATLRAWRHQGRGPAYVRLGRAIRYLTIDINEFLYSNRHSPRSRPEPLAERSPTELEIRRLREIARREGRSGGNPAHSK